MLVFAEISFNNEVTQPAYNLYESEKALCFPQLKYTSFAKTSSKCIMLWRFRLSHQLYHLYCPTLPAGGHCLPPSVHLFHLLFSKEAVLSIAETLLDSANVWLPTATSENVDILYHIHLVFCHQQTFHKTPAYFSFGFPVHSKCCFHDKGQLALLLAHPNGSL